MHRHRFYVTFYPSLFFIPFFLLHIHVYITLYDDDEKKNETERRRKKKVRLPTGK